MSTEYRIEFAIQRRIDDAEDFTEIGFGSSGAWRDLEAACYSIESGITRGEWETEGDMPEPGFVLAAIRSATEDGKQ